MSPPGRPKGEYRSAQREGAQVSRYAVVGHPVEHSLSPLIHAEFARQTGERMSYEKLPLPRATRSQGRCSASPPAAGAAAT